MTALPLIADFYFSAIVEFVFCEEINARISLVTNDSAGMSSAPCLQNISDAVVLNVFEAGFTPINDGNAQA